MLNAVVLFSFSVLAVSHAQQFDNLIAEVHPPLSWQSCAANDTCTTNQASVVIDANWRWLHSATSLLYCNIDNYWNSTLCPDNRACAANCALDGADYSGMYGITTSGNSIRMKFVNSQNYYTNVGSRVYLMASDDTNYQLFKLKNKEFTFDVDASNLPCGLNGALYFSEMDADGGLSKYPGNKAGARYGTGYCDAKCPHDTRFINGEANMEGWTPSPTNANAGSGRDGACCNEMDIWEANSISTAYTPHSCKIDGPYRCSGTECGDGDERYSGVCDKDGCDFNPYRMGNTSFYGPGKIIDTSKKLTVITQFLTEDGTDTGALKEIRRVYVQGGKILQNSKINVPGMNSTLNSITTNFCTQQKTAFGDNNQFSALGGFSPIDKAFSKGVVLVLSILDNRDTDMLWLDSNYPVDADPTKPGVARGTCGLGSAVPLQDLVPDSSVTFSNIKFGPIGSTYASTGTSTSQITSAGSTPATTP